MEELKGSVVFLDDSLPTNEQIENVIAQVAEEKSAADVESFFVVGTEVGNFTEAEAKILKGAGINLFIAANFESDTKKKFAGCGISSIDLRKKDLEDIFLSFGRKETQGKIVAAENGLFKLKLISGSFSKSYIFRPEC